MPLPDLEPDFSNARLDDVSYGPHREITLTLRPLIWIGSIGHYGEPVRVRFGGIFNFDAVQAFFAGAPHHTSELAYLRYDKETLSKSGQLFFDLAWERTDAPLRLECRHLSINEEIIA